MVLSIKDFQHFVHFLGYKQNIVIEREMLFKI